MKHVATMYGVCLDEVKKFVGMDVHKNQITVAVADADSMEVRSHGKIENTESSLRRLLRKLGEPHELCFCYEAGFCGYEIYRQLNAMGAHVFVIAPSMIPKKPGDKVKNDKRDALQMARLLRAGELTPIWVPSEEHEAIRQLIRARASAKDREKSCKHRIHAFMLLHRRHWPGRSNWSKSHFNWLANQPFDYPAQHIVFSEMLDELEEATQRVRRLEGQIEVLSQTWPLLPVVKALMTLRGVSFTIGSLIVAELGDLRRFDRPSGLMAYLGMTPSESTSDGKGSRGQITRAGNARLRRMLIEAAQTYRYDARKSELIRKRNEGQPKEVQRIAWNAQLRLCPRYRLMRARGKTDNKVKMAIGRELCGFIWEIGVFAARQLEAPKQEQASVSS